MKVREVMSKEVVTVTSDTTFPELVEQLVGNDVSGLPVVDDGKLVGIVTEADLVTKGAYGGSQERRRPLEMIIDVLAGGEAPWMTKAKGNTASDVMTTPVWSTKPNDDIRAAARRMIHNDVKRLPVVEDGKLVGIVSRADLLRAMNRDDDQIATDIRSAFADPLRSPERTELEVAVTDGQVAITGSAEFPHDVPVLTSVAWSIPGVVSVQNDTVGREEAPRL